MNENIPYIIPFGILIVNGIKQIVKNVGTISSILCISNDLNSFVICAPIINNIGADILEGINLIKGDIIRHNINSIPVTIDVIPVLPPDNIPDMDSI